MSRFNFPVRFEQEKFNGESRFYFFYRRGKISVDRKNRPILEKKPSTSVQNNISWLEDNVISPASHPVAFMEAILCRKLTPNKKKRR